MEMLILAGTGVNTLNHKQHSPLQLAVAKPSKRCVTALLKHETCNVNLQVQPSRPHVCVVRFLAPYGLRGCDMP